jgi:hypothetical protein
MISLARHTLHPTASKRHVVGIGKIEPARMPSRRRASLQQQRQFADFHRLCCTLDILAES